MLGIYFRSQRIGRIGPGIHGQCLPAFRCFTPTSRTLCDGVMEGVLLPIVKTTKSRVFYVTPTLKTDCLSRLMRPRPSPTSKCRLKDSPHPSHVRTPPWPKTSPRLGHGLVSLSFPFRFISPPSCPCFSGTITPAPPSLHSSSALDHVAASYAVF
jgi:hypothetical protein